VRLTQNKLIIMRLRTIVIILALSACSFSQPRPRHSAIEPGARALLAHISVDSLRGHLSFLASDTLEGRDTPSRGLDLAAEYIAAGFRRAGLEPAGDDGYFQTAIWPAARPNPSGAVIEFKQGDATIVVESVLARWSSDDEISFAGMPVIKFGYQEGEAVEALGAGALGGKALLTEAPDLDSLTGSERGPARRTWQNFLAKVRSARPACVLLIRRTAPEGLLHTRLLNPRAGRVVQPAPISPQVTLYDARVIRMYDSAKSGESLASVSLHIPPDVRFDARLRNVIGVVRGSDPRLKDTYVLVTAHYDHLGIRDSGTGDRIYNGANDDGSGTVSVVELASAFASLKPRPKRSIVFITFFGEEKGMLGSRYYGDHPVFPIQTTIADVNLEQVGRTDDDEGPQVGTATMTGLDYSEIGTIFQAAGQALGVKVLKHPRNSDAYFSRSDNQSLADEGVPAHTLCVAFSYPDYHGVGDEWDKIDYANMARVDKLVALGIYRIAQSSAAPRWNVSNPKAAKYVEAWKKHHPE